ncbi:SPOSA6832_01420 [Sporobolomyces salmonicolor]|uniref:SPOSA6832_01420-mRNA-1:cds n=1 Tax=Sporidiobolus salmonicolor TaxID=5005 RepID=A0A0D6EIM1_SPOSA|nr:SPOSA6832_01420 [Sporobolomyces salmonicolor]
MNFLSSLGTAVLNASSAALQGSSAIPGVQGYQLGDKVLSFEGKSLWSLWSGVKKDDSTPVSIFSFDLSSPSPSSFDRRSLLPLARNAFRKLRALRHPNILKFLDGSESDHAVWIITEPVRSLALELEGGGVGGGVSEESMIYGLLHVCTALGFLNRDGASVHGNLRATSVWVTSGGEWKLGGMEVCSRLDEADGVMWNYGGLLPDAKTHASPEVRKGGWTALKEYDASALDSYLLHLFLYTLFNGPLPSSFLSPSTSDSPSLPAVRGSLPPALFQPWRRLGNPNPAARLQTTAFLDLSNSPSDGIFPSNRLVKLSTALEGFSLASENERAALIRTLRAISTGSSNAKTEPLPEGFLKYKVLPSLVHTLEFGGQGGPQLLPVVLSLAEGMAEKEYQNHVVQPVIRMFATPDRAMRMALLEGLEKFADKLSGKDVVEKVWPHLLTGFGDVVPVIREATVKSVLLIAPKLNDRILNNDLLRYLSKTQTDVEPGIRTNTCILLSRLARFLQPSTQRKVLIPAFARALRDPFVHARIAGLMALMATCEGFEREDLAGKVIPAMSICLVDREKAVRDQGFKAIDMFVKKCEALTANMVCPFPPPLSFVLPLISFPSLQPETALPEAGQQSAALQAASQTQPGLATNAAGAAGALAGWAFASVSKKVCSRFFLPLLLAGLLAHSENVPQLSSAELSAPIERQNSNPLSVSAPTTLNLAASSAPSTAGLPGGFATEEAAAAEDWGGDLMDVNADAGDWGASPLLLLPFFLSVHALILRMGAIGDFESGHLPPPLHVDPLAARLSSSKPKPAALGNARQGGALRLGATSRSSALRVPMDMDATDCWDLDADDGKPSAAASTFGAKPKPAPIPWAAAPSARATPVVRKIETPRPAPSVAFAIAPPAHSPTPTTSTTRSKPPSPFPQAAMPSLVPILPTVSTIPPLLPSPLRPPSAPLGTASPALVPTLVSPATATPRPASPAVSATGSSTGSAAPMSKEEKAAKLAEAREERRLRMAAAKAGKR